MDCLGTVVERFNAEVIVSSSWRLASCCSFFDSSERAAYDVNFLWELGGESSTQEAKGLFILPGPEFLLFVLQVPTDAGLAFASSSFPQSLRERLILIEWYRS